MGVLGRDQRGLGPRLERPYVHTDVLEGLEGHAQTVRAHDSQTSTSAIAAGMAWRNRIEILAEYAP